MIHIWVNSHITNNMTIMDLPNELVAEIFCYTGVATLIICSQVNRCWNGLSKIRYVWEFKRVNCRNGTDLKGICHLHTLRLFDMAGDVSVLGHVHTLDLYFTKVTDVSALGHVHTLIFWCMPVNGISELGHVHTLSARHINVTDVSSLGHLHTLKIWYTQVNDGGALDRVHTLIQSPSYSDNCRPDGSI